MSFSLHTYLLALVAATLPLGALTTTLLLHADLRRPGWLITGAALLLVALGLGFAVARWIADVVASLTRATRALARDEAPVLGTLPILELDDLARAVTAAGNARRDGESRLRAAEARLAALLDAAPAALMAVDAERRVTLFNRAAASLFGCPASEATGVAADRFFSQRFLRVIDAHLEGARGRLPALTAGGGDTAVGFRRDGTELALDAALARLEGPSGPSCVLALRDVTEPRRRESAQTECSGGR